MRILSALVFVLLFCNLALGQWLKLESILRKEDVPDGFVMGSRLQLNDAGQAFYLLRKQMAPQANRIYVDGVVVAERVASRIEIGEINDNGMYAFSASDQVFVGDLDGNVSRVVRCCEIYTTYNGFGSFPISPPQIDSQGKPYFVGSTLEQMPRGQAFGYDGRASIYTGPNPIDDLVFGELHLDENSSSLAKHAFAGWDVNEHGVIAIGLGFVLPGERVEGELIRFDELSHVSINNHGEFTRVVDLRKGEDVRRYPGLAVYGGEESLTFFTEGYAKRAYINDQRKIAYQVGSTSDQRTDLKLLDAETGDVTTLMNIEDVDSLESRRNDPVILLDFNDVGQMALTIDGDFYIGTASSSPVADLNFDAETTADDIDQLAKAIRESSTRERFDLNQDGIVSVLDSTYWVDDLVGTALGDADLDFDVDFGDFLILSNAFGSSSGWGGGDFDGTGQTEFKDFLLLSENFGLTGSTASVPEPRFDLISILTVMLGRKKGGWVKRSCIL